MRSSSGLMETDTVDLFLNNVRNGLVARWT
jgi:hypothetical protein